MGHVGWRVINKARVGGRRKRDQDSTTDRSHQLSESNLTFTVPFLLLALK